MVKKKNPVAVKKLIESRKNFTEKLVFCWLRHFSRSIFMLLIFLFLFFR